MYLKESLRITQHFVAGTPVTRSDGVPVGIVNGLPRIVPGVLRSNIRGGHHTTQRVVLTLFSLYRIIKVPGKLKLETIVSGPSGVETLPTTLVTLGTLSFLKLVPKPSSLGKISLRYSGSAGPSTPHSM